MFKNLTLVLFNYTVLFLKISLSLNYRIVVMLVQYWYNVKWWLISGYIKLKLLYYIRIIYYYWIMNICRGIDLYLITQDMTYYRRVQFILQRNRLGGEERGSMPDRVNERLWNRHLLNKAHMIMEYNWGINFLFCQWVRIIKSQFNVSVVQSNKHHHVMKK